MSSIKHGLGMSRLLKTVQQDSHLKLFKNSFWQEVQKTLLYPYFDSVILQYFTL